MATKLLSYIYAPCFTNELPEVLRFQTDGEQLNIEVWAEGTRLILVTLYPNNKVVTFHDLRQLLENYMLANHLSMLSFHIEAYSDTFKQQDLYTSATHSVIFLNRRLRGETFIFLETRFLSMLTSKRISTQARERLHYFLFGDETAQAAFYITYIPANEDTPITGTFGVGETHTSAPTISWFDISYPNILFKVESALGTTGHRILACTVRLGQRTFTYFFDHSLKPDLTLVFRNCFNLYEQIELLCTTTAKQKVERSTALTSGQYSFYDQATEQTFEVQSAPLPLDVARWTEQLFASHLVRIVDYTFTEMETEDDYQQILITESDYEISDDDNTLNSVKFTYQYTAKDPQLLAPFYSEEITGGTFDSTFNPSFT